VLEVRRGEPGSRRGAHETPPTPRRLRGPTLDPSDGLRPQFPKCDGAHMKHNKETGDNCGPIIVSNDTVCMTVD